MKHYCHCGIFFELEKFNPYCAGTNYETIETEKAISYWLGNNKDSGHFFTCYNCKRRYTSPNIQNPLSEVEN